MYVVDTRPKVSPLYLRNGLRKYKSYSTMLCVQVGFIFHTAFCQLDVLTAKASQNILAMCLWNHHQYYVTDIYAFFIILLLKKYS